MSNLSELLPAGAGAKSADFVASGTLGSGQTVVLKTDGTVEAVSQVTEGFDTPTVFENASTSYASAAYDSTSNKIVIAYTDVANSNKGTAIIGTVSGTLISFGSAVVFNNAITYDIATTYDSANNKIVIAYQDRGNSLYGTAIVGTVSGTSISFGSEVVFYSGESGDISGAYDPVNNKIIIAYKGLNAAGWAIVGTVSGTSISFGSAGQFESASTDFTSTTYDSTSNKIIIAYTTGANGKAVVGTVSGTSISFGSTVTFNSTSIQFTSANYDSVNNKTIVSYRDLGNSSYGTAVVGTVSGTSISFGSEVIFNSATTVYQSATYDSTNNKIVIAYRDGGNSEYGTAIVGTVSGTSISFGSELVFESASSNFISATYDSANNKIVIAYADAGNASYGTAVMFQNAGSNNTDFIGITDQAIADTATGAVIVHGGVSEKLTVGADYYVQDDGSIAASGNTPYSIAGSTYDNINFSVNSQASSPSDVKFNADGSKMYVVSPSAITIYEYDLGTNFDVSSSVYARSKSLSAQAVEIYAITFNPDGTKMYSLSQVSGSNYYIDQYSLSTAFDVSSASYDSVRSPFPLQTIDNSPQNIIFNNDGSKIYMVGIGNDKVYEFPLSTAYVISSASNSSGINFSVASQETSPKGISFNPTGTQMFIVGPNSDTIFQYNLTSGFDITTASYSSISYNVNPEEPDPRGFTFNSDGTKFYIIGGVFPRGVYQYSTTSASTTVPAGRALSTTSILLEG